MSKFEMTPKQQAEFRESTHNSQIMSPTRKCFKCGKPTNIRDGIYIKGTSRHNPGKFFCKGCKSVG